MCRFFSAVFPRASLIFTMLPWNLHRVAFQQWLNMQTIVVGYAWLQFITINGSGWFSFNGFLKATDRDILPCDKNGTHSPTWDTVNSQKAQVASVVHEA